MNKVLLKIFYFNKEGLFVAFKEKSDGFSLLEILVSLSIFSVILVVVLSFFSSMSTSDLKTRSDSDALENARGALEEITYEIKGAKSIYTPTTTASQLSLETSRYLPVGEDTTYIDFFLCGSAVCLKKEFQDPIAITSDSVEVTNLVFSQISTGGAPSVPPSVQVNITVSSASGGNSSSVSLASATSLRNY
jgi:prepilin-type N-terminal cleavage/methylation domain-containing protein